GWLAIRGLQRGSAPGPVPEAVTVPDPTDGATQPTPGPAPDAEAPAPAGETAAPALASLPAEPAARTALYDSLWSARSPLFDPLLETVEAGSDERAVDRA